MGVRGRARRPTDRRTMGRRVARAGAALKRKFRRARAARGPTKREVQCITHKGRAARQRHEGGKCGWFAHPLCRWPWFGWDTPQAAWCGARRCAWSIGLGAWSKLLTKCIACVYVGRAGSHAWTRANKAHLEFQRKGISKRCGCGRQHPGLGAFAAGLPARSHVPPAGGFSSQRGLAPGAWALIIVV